MTNSPRASACDTIFVMSTPANPFGPPASGGGGGAGSSYGPPPSRSGGSAGQPGQAGFGPASGGGLPTQTGPSLNPVGPPTALLVIAGALAILGTAIAVVFWGQWPSVIGWVLAGPIAIVMTGLFVTRDTQRRAEPLYLRPGWVSAAYTAVMALVVIGVIVGATAFAFWVGRR